MEITEDHLFKSRTDKVWMSLAHQTCFKYKFKYLYQQFALEMGNSVPYSDDCIIGFPCKCLDL